MQKQQSLCKNFVDREIGLSIVLDEQLTLMQLVAFIPENKLTEYITKLSSIVISRISE